jgi:hypothetical protein
MRRHREREKEETEIAKVAIEEIRFIKNQLWKVCYYGIITYAGLFTVINIFKDKLVGDLSWLSMYYYTIIMLTASISLKIVDKLYHNIGAFRNYFGNKNGKSIKNYNQSVRFSHPDNEQFLGILFILLLGYFLSIIYVCTIYGFNRGIYLSMSTYLGLEGMIYYYRRRTKGAMMEDINMNIVLFVLLYTVYLVSQTKIVFMQLGQFLIKPF